MKTLNEELEAVKDDNTIIGAKPPKVRTLFDVVKTGNYSLEDFKKSKELVAPEFESDINVRVREGISRGVQDIKNVPQGVEIFGGQVEMKIGGWADSEETVERGRNLIKTALDELDAKEKNYYQSAIPMSSKDYESLSFGLGQGITNYGAMLATGYLGGAVAGIGSMAVLEGTQKAQEKIGYYTEKTGDKELKGYTPEQAGKDVALTAIYTAGSAIMEKKLGYGAQRKLFKMPIGEKVKNVTLTSLSEGGTETLQELYATGIDFVGGYIDSSKLPERFLGAVQEGVIGGILGGTAGIAAAVNHRSQAKQILRENLQNTVPQKDLENVVDAVYESTSDSMANIITQELAQSEQLRNKHGAIYESLKSEVAKQIQDNGAYSDVDEMKLSQYIEGTAKMFADQVLGEANNRGVVIDDVLKSSEIVYKDGRLYLQGATQETKLKRLKKKRETKTPSMLQFIRLNGGIRDDGGELKNMDAGKQFIGLVNKNGVDVDEMGEKLWESGYFMQRPTPAEVLDFIDDELKGVKHYPLGYVKQEGITQDENEARLDDAISEYADIMGYDLSKMSYDEKTEIYAQMQKNLFADETQEVEPEETEDFDFADNEFFQVADENARLDDIYPEYKGETININGQEKTVYNSNGDRIAKSKEALENFYRWFGDSKVVDEQGRPLVVYHGTSAEFSIFDKTKADSSVGLPAFYFSSNEQYSREYGSISMPVYLKAENVFDIGKNVPDGWYELKTNEERVDLLKKQWYDGVFDYNAGATEYAVFNPNQIKSTSNRGTYSESENIYYQFAGERAKTAALDELNRAKQLEANGVDNEEIRQQTGWFKGADGKWRFEISDEDAKMLGTIEELRQKNEDKHEKTLKKLAKLEKEREKLRIAVNKNEITENEYYSKLEENDKKIQTLMDNDEGFRIGDIMKHDKLYEAYPFIANINVFISERIDPDEAYYDRKTQSITVGTNVAKEPASSINLKGIILHEIQHAIQATERFARGGSPDEFESMEQLRRGLQQAKELLTEANEAIEQAEDLGYSDETEINGKSVSFYKEQKADAQEQIDYANERISNYKDPYQKYKSLYGEIEARNTAIRSEFTEELRGKILPERTQDIKNADAIVVFDGKPMAYKPETYNQIKNLPKQKGKIKGAFDALTKSIEITSEADFSTYQHEFAHFWLDNIWNYAQSGKASPEYMKRFNEIKKWLGVKGDYPTRTQHEKFARAYEKYLYRGEYANPIIGDTFREYEDFIREVYSSIAEIDTRAGVKYKPVPKLVYDFFNSMVSGTLPYYGGIDEPKEVVEKETKEVKEYVKEEQKVLAENTQNYALKPVQTDTETGYLTAYKKMTGEEVEAGVVNLEKEQAKAEKFVNENPDLAKQIVDGVAPVPDGMLKNTIYLAYDKLQKRLGNTQNRVNSLMNQALELRRMGQEISSQRLAYRDETSPLYWIQTVQDNKASALADSNKMTVKELNDLVNKSIKDGMKQGKTAKDIAKDLREQLGVTQFYQEEVYPTEETEQASYNYIYKYVNQQLGLGMTMEEAETITRKADDMLSSLENSKAPNGNPSVEYFVKQKDLENYANSIAPSSQARVLVSVVGRGNLLSSIKSPLTNVISNAYVGAYRSAVRRIMLGQYESIVSPELIKQNKQYSWEIFRKTGYNVNNITPETPRNTILGEKLTHSEGEGKIRWLGRFYENLIYKWSLGAGDVIFKDYAFTDYVALKATKESGGDVNKANEIFKDACLIEPQTELGQQIRDEAIQESLIATYQNKGLISDKALKARQAMDFGVGFGEFIAPFVKTPANVVSMGLKAGFGSVKAVASEIQRDIKAGKIQKPTKENIELVVQNGLGLLVASLLLGAIDDEDYMPPYALATNKDKQLAKELNIAYNSIRIGNTWVSLDYLGPLASPLVGLLQARREDGILNSIFGYTKSGMIQSLSIPAFGNIADIFTNIQNTVRKDGADVAAETLNDTVQAVYSRTVPSIFSDVAKMLDKYDRETKGHEIKAKIPLVRESLPKKVSVTSGRAESLDSPIQELLFGARAKTQVVNPVAKELQRLNNEGFGVSLTPVTQRGKLSEVDDKTKEKVRQDFAKEYSKQVGNLIKSASYKRMDDEDKQQAIDKIRRKTVESLKKRYLK